MLYDLRIFAFFFTFKVKHIRKFFLNCVNYIRVILHACALDQSWICIKDKFRLNRAENGDNDILSEKYH
jgi:hypothetical protein